MRVRQKSDNGSESNIFWVTMTDLMTALVLVFMVLFFYTYVLNHREQIQSKVEQEKASVALKEVLKKEDITADIDISTGVVKIQDLSLFKLNSSELSGEGKAFLEKFVPAYMDSLFSNQYMSEHLAKIIIEGHTDSQMYQGNFSKDEQYMKNMQLSMERAYKVADYMMKSPYNKKYGDRLRKIILVEGASFSNPVTENGRENYDKSRRVELKLVMKK